MSNSGKELKTALPDLRERVAARFHGLTHSLQWRILLWHSLILTLVISAFAVATYLHQRRTCYNEIDTELAAAVEVLVGKLQAADSESLESFLKEDSFDTESPGSLRSKLQVPQTFSRRRYRHSFENPYFVIWAGDGTELMASTVEVQVPAQGSDSPSFFGPHSIRNRGSFREALGIGPRGVTLVVGRLIDADLRDLRALPLILGSIGCAAILLGVVGGWFLSRDSVRPIRQISAVASTISEQDLSQRIDLGQMDSEFSQLSQTLNNTFERLERAFSQQVKFTADASHELRTPLSVIRMHQELALSKVRTADEYQELLSVCQRQANRMTTLVDSLLELARLDNPEAKLACHSVDLNALTARSIEDIQPLANQKLIAIHADLVEATVSADQNRLSQVLLNLLKNAVTHSPQSGRIDVAVESDSVQARISVSDSGDGIPREHLDRIFERFFRIDESRSRDSGGSGLGLAISKAIVEAHGGDLCVVSDPGVRTTFTVSLPLLAELDCEGRSGAANI